MHYYKRNLGDYYKKAGRLSILQHGVFNLLIDACYDRESFPTLDEAIEWVWASNQEEVEAVEFVLKRFFTAEDGVYVQKRIREELEEYKKQAERNKQVAIDREAKRARERTTRDQKGTTRAQGVHDSLNKVHDSSPNQKPLTNNQKPLTTNQGGGKPPPSAPALVDPDPDVDVDPDRKFEMHDDWEPDRFFAEQCKSSGIDFEKIPIDRGKQILAEFKGYWVSSSVIREHTHREWQHKLWKAYIRDYQETDLYGQRKQSNQQRLEEFAGHIWNPSLASDF